MSQSIHTILIIGGTSGIGEAFAKRFHSMGKKVIVTGRREARLSELEQALPGLETYKMDVTHFSAIPIHLKTLFTKHSIDTVWINSGIQYASSMTDTSSTTDERIMDEITTNTTAPILLARHIIPHLMQRRSETTLIMTSSRLGFVPMGKVFPVYCAEKAAIHAFAVGLRQALDKTNVNVIELVPPYVATNLEVESRDKLQKVGVKPMPLGEFTDEIFKVLDNHAAKDLKEVAAGGGVVACEAWRSSIGKILEISGIGG